MKKNQRKLALHRDTLRKLAAPALREAAAARNTQPYCSDLCTEVGCVTVSCLTCGCPTRGNCTVLC
ncbi:MAG TPA: hypothetical protein VKY89_17790 [Thermoanaerobaculia bacterium]|nr:hypothetical protein [Thermoanaerobaculia bacterium]